MHTHAPGSHHGLPPSRVSNTAFHRIEPIWDKMSPAPLSKTVQLLYGNIGSVLLSVEQKNVRTRRACKSRGLRGLRYGHHHEAIVRIVQTTAYLWSLWRNSHPRLGLIRGNTQSSSLLQQFLFEIVSIKL